MAEDQISHYANDYVEFDVPLGWTMANAATDNAPAQFVSRNGQARLTLTYLFYDTQASRSDLEGIFNEYFDIRLASESEYLACSDVIESSVTNSDQDAIWRTFAGLERKSNRRFNGLVAARNGKLLTFYIESLDQPPHEHNELVHSVFRSVEIK